MTIVERILFGKELPLEIHVHKYATLRGYFFAICIGIAFFYSLLDSYNHNFTFIPWYCLMVLVSFIGLILNRLKFYAFTNFLIVSFANFIVFLFADSDSLYGGLFFYFIATSLCALILFKYENLLIGFACAIGSIIIGLIAFVFDFHLTELPLYTNPEVKISFMANFVIASFTCSFMIFFLIRENYISEKLLEEKQKQFELAVKGAKAGIYEWDLNNNSIFITDYWKELLGYQHHELEPISIEQYISFVHPDDLASSQQKIEEVLKTIEPYQGEVRLKTKSGIYKWFLDSGLVRIEGEKRFVVGSLIDIDDRKKAEQEILTKSHLLAKTNEELDRFVYSASHDMRAPLSSILGLINLAELSDQPSEMKVYHAMMKERIKVMEGFIKEVTDYSRNARLELKNEKHSLFQLVKEITDNLAYSDISGNIMVSIDVDHNVIVNTDASRLKIVLNNLISNAYKYHRKDIENAFIKIIAKKLEREVEIQIIDNGLGIDEEHHLKIFDMFYRATENSEGSGLGLYIVKETLDKLEGTIKVSSKLKEGSTFTVLLPQS